MLTSIILITVAAAAGDNQDAKVVEIESGSAAFQSATNMPGIEVTGKTNALKVQAEVSKSENKLLLRRIDASIPVKTLSTGMQMRDEHMRKYIFRTADGAEPDVRFTSEEGTCEAGGSAQEFSCPVSGSLSIRGVLQPFTLRLKVKQEGSASDKFRAIGDGVVKLSTYGIPAPSQFGVKPIDDVKIHLDFTVKASHTTSAAVLH
ncbi:MAG: YceI family protein [Bryobacteraceae bacterium]